MKSINQSIYRLSIYCLSILNIVKNTLTHATHSILFLLLALLLFHRYKMSNSKYDFEASTADQEGVKTTQWKWVIQPRGNVGRIITDGNGQDVKILSIEGISGVGKTKILNKLSGSKKVKALTLDFFEFVNSRPAEEKGILNWKTKSSNPLLAGYYNEWLNQTMNKTIQNLPPGIEVVVSDRYKLSDTIYNLLFSFVKEGDKNLSTADIVKKFKDEWKRYVGYICKTYTNDLNSYIIVIDSRSDKVLKRITERNTSLDCAFIKIFQDYPEVQSIIWAYVADYLGLPLVDMQGDFISDNIKEILGDCGVEI